MLDSSSSTCFQLALVAIAVVASNFHDTRQIQFLRSRRMHEEPGDWKSLSQKMN